MIGATSSALTVLPRSGWTADSNAVPADAGNALDGNTSTGWSSGRNALNNDVFTVDMKTRQTFAQLTLDAGNATNDYPRNFQVRVSNDNSTWTTVATATGTSAIVNVTFAVQTARYVQVKLTAGFNSWWTMKELTVWSPVLARTGWVASGSANAASDTPDKALDGTASTRWSTSADQAPGQFFQVDLQSKQNFNQLTLDAGTSTGKYPRGYEVYVSNDGTTWGSPVATGTGTTEFISVTFPWQWARYVKVVQTATSAGNVWAIHEFNLYGGPTDLVVLSQAGWSATKSPAGEGAASLAFDGNATTTRWSTNPSDQAPGQYFRLDLGATRTFSQITLDTTPVPTDYPAGYEVRVSNDDVTYSAPIATGTPSTALVTISFAPQTARYIKITQTGTKAARWTIYELNVWAPALSRAGWVLTSSATSSGNTAAKAMDNNTGTRWDTSANQTPSANQWFQIDMVTPHAFNEISLDAGASPNNYPRGYEVRTSNDGTTWSAVLASGAGTSGLTTIKFLTQTARFIKITQTGTASPGVHWSIYEVDIWRGLQPCDAGCTASDQCHDAGTCDVYTGVCTNPNKANNTACNDANACTTGEVCTAGVCGGGSTVTCTGADQCHTVAACVPATGCPAPVAKENGAACDDGNACTQTDTCQAGTCTGGNPVVCEARQCNYPGTCNPSTGVCAYQQQGDWSSCDDGNPCSVRDACLGGVCTAITNKVCAAQDQCHQPGTCNPTTGACSNPLAPDDTTCNDGNACTGASSCHAGACTGSVTVTCSSTNPNEVVSCDPAAQAAYPTNDLVALWHLDADYRDATENANHWSVIAGSNAVKVVPGKQGGAYEFGQGVCLQNVATWSSEVSEGSGLTFAAWVKPTGTCAGTRDLFRRDWQLSVQTACTESGGTGISAGINLGAGPFYTFPYTTPAGNLPPDQWSMVAVTWDKVEGVLHLFVNGAEVATKPAAGTLARGTPYMTLGCYNTYFVGAIDEAAWYRRALTPVELGQLIMTPNACKAAPRCPDPDPCTKGVYNPATDSCTSEPKVDGTACSDGNGCTQNDVCQAGVCQAGLPVSCPAPTGLCDVSSCDPTWKEPAPGEVIATWHLDGSGADGSGQGRPLSGLETGLSVAGKYGDAVHFDAAPTSCANRTSGPGESFVNAAGVTLSAWVKPDLTCAQYHQGTIIERSGELGMRLECYGAAPRVNPSINWTNIATQAFLTPGVWSHVVTTYDRPTGIVRVYINGVDAGGGSVAPNTELGTGIYGRSAAVDVGCGAGAAIDEATILRRPLSAAEVQNLYAAPVLCKEQPKTCPCRASNACDPLTGVCTGAPIADGTSCSDGNACTTGDTCSAGTCGGSAVTCPVADQCHTAGACDPVSGCSMIAKADGTICNDSNPCSSGDVCSAGVCVATSYDATCTGGAGYLQPQFFPPPPGQAVTDIYGLNNAGTAVGYSPSPAGSPWPEGQDAEPVTAARGAPLVPLPRVWAGGPMYSWSINDQGYVSGSGGPGGSQAADWMRPVLYRPDHTYDILPVPIGWMEATNNYGPATGLPDMVGATVTAAGTLGAWHLDGNGKDAAGPTVFTVPSQSLVDGRYGEAVNFDGTTCLSATATAETAVNDGAGITLMAWVMPDASVCSGTAPKVITKRGWDYSLLLRCNSSGVPGISHSFRVAQEVPSPPVGSVPVGQWTHIAISWDHRHVRSYVNGVVVGNEALSGVVNSVGPDVSIGCHPTDATYGFKGVIDEVATFKHPMGADQIGRYMSNRGDYRPALTVPHGDYQWSRYADGFFEVIAPPAGEEFAGGGNTASTGRNGLIVGWQALSAGGSMPMVYTPETGLRPFSTLLPAGSQWEVRAITAPNASGILAGDGEHAGVRSLFKFDLNTNEIVDLGPIPNRWNPDQYVFVGNINAQGHITASLYDDLPYWAQRALVYTPELGLVDLTDLTAVGSEYTLANATINDNDELVGMAWRLPMSAATRTSYRLKLPTANQVDCVGKAEGAACNDHNGCTQTDTCQAGTCVGANPVTCAAPGQCRTGGTCNPADGTCPYVNKPQGTMCDDGNAATQSETCQAGVCTAPAQYLVITDAEIEDLGFPAGATGSSGNDINARGQVVGGSSVGGRSHTVTWNAANQVTDISSFYVDVNAGSTANAVNDDGVMVGTITWPDGMQHSFRYSDLGSWQDFGLFGDGAAGHDIVDYYGSGAVDINSSGQFAGYYTIGGQVRGYRFTDGIGIEDMGSLVGGLTRAFAIDDRGRVFGASWVPGTPATSDPTRWGHAVMFEDTSAELVDLNNLIDNSDPASQWTLSVVSGVSGDYVVGTGLHNGEVRPFRFNLSSHVVDEMWPGWGGLVFGQDVNAAGDVVGWGYLSPGFTQPAAFLYTDQLGFKNLNDIVGPGAGWNIKYAGGINDRGDIVGKGAHGGHDVAFRMHAPTSPQLACQGKAEGATCSNGYSCADNNVCHDFVCGGGAPADAVCLRVDGVVDVGVGKWAVVLGYDNFSTDTVVPTINQVTLDGVVQSDPRPVPPPWLQRGSHPGAYLPTITSSDTLSWRVNGQMVTATVADLKHLTPLPGRADIAVMVDDQTIVIEDAELLASHAGSAFATPSPTLDKVVMTSAGHYVAILGYETPNGVYGNILPTIRRPGLPGGAIGGYPNRLLVDDVDSSDLLPTWFGPTKQGALTVPFTTHLSWTLGDSTVTADPSQAENGTQYPEGIRVSLADGTSRLIAPSLAFAEPETDKEPGVFGVIGRSTPLTSGKTSGDLGVTADGAVSYRIPLWVPPGRGGLQPELALSYSSRRGPGELGLGWGLEGQSAITRCEKTVATDGANNATFIAYAAWDAFCLDGKRLIYQSSDNSYRKQEDDFTKIVVHGDRVTQTTWEVFLRDGRILTYGGPDATAVKKNVLGSRDTSWSLSEVRDRVGNKIKYVYDNTTWGGGYWGLAPSTTDHVLARIEYVFAGGQSLATRTVRVVREPRKRPESGYVSGVYHAMTTRILGLDMEGPLPEGGTAVLRSYRFRYDVGSTGRDRLSSVQECDGEVGLTFANLSPKGVCKRPTTFGYSDVVARQPHRYAGNLAPNLVHSSGADRSWFRTDAQVGDFNGDGREDIVYQKVSHYQYAKGGPTSQIGPLSEYRVFFRLSDGTNLGPEIELTSIVPAYRHDDFTGPVEPPVTYEVVDVDGNGAADLVRDDGTVFLSAFRDMTPVFNPSTTLNAGENHLIGDLNGDGLADSLSQASPKWINHLGLSMAMDQQVTTGLSGEAKWASAAKLVQKAGTEFLVDTGSGIRGFVDIGATPYDPGLPLPKITPSVKSHDVQANYMFLDINGDGLSDALTLPVGSNQCGLNIAQRWENSPNCSREGTPYHNPECWNPGNIRPQYFLGVGRTFAGGLDAGVNLTELTAGVSAWTADMNQDGRGDLILNFQDSRDANYASDKWQGNISVYESNGAGFASPYVLKDDQGQPIKSTFSEWHAQTATYVGDDCARAKRHSAKPIDINGDGIKDIVVGPDVYVFPTQRPDMLTGIVDGQGRDVAIVYQSVATPNVVVGPNSEPLYTPATNCTYPQRCVNDALWLVSDVYTDDTASMRVQRPEPCAGCSSPADGIAYYRHWQYSYADARLSVTGDGWLGMQARTTYDRDRGSIKRVTYDNVTQENGHYFRAGKPILETTSFPIDRHDPEIFDGLNEGQGLTRHVEKHMAYDLKGGAGDPRIRALLPSGGNIKVWDENESGTQYLVTRVTSTTDYDGETGDLMSSIDIDAEGMAHRWSIQYDDRRDTWLIGLPAHIVETGVPTNGDDITRRTTDRTYDAQGRLATETIEPDGTDSLHLERVFGLDRFGNVISLTERARSGEVHLARTVFDKEGMFPVARRNALGQVSTEQHDPGTGTLIFSTDPNGAAQVNRIDGFGRPRGSFDANGVSCDIHYSRLEDRIGYRSTTECTNGQKTEVRFDRADRQTDQFVRQADGRMAHAISSYDKFGRLNDSTAPFFDADPQVKHTSMSFDPLDRKTRQIEWVLTEGGQSQVKDRYWYYRGREAVRFDPPVDTVDQGIIRPRHRTLSDMAGHTISAWDYKGTSDTDAVVTNYEYGAFDTVRHIRSRNTASVESGDIATVYDVRGRIRSKSDPDAGGRVFVTDPWGNVTSMTDAKMETTTYQHDALNRVIAEASSVDEVSRTFWDTSSNGIGRKAGAVAAPGLGGTTIGYDFDLAGNVASERMTVGGQALAIARTFELGRLSTITYPTTGMNEDPILLAYQYNPSSGQVEKITSQLGTVVYWQATARDATGRLSGEDLGADTSRVTSYDPSGRWAGAVVTNGANEVLQDVSVTYDGRGLVDTRTDRAIAGGPEIAERYQYDVLGRLREWSSIHGGYSTSYGYDDFGNRTSRQYHGAVDGQFQTFVYGGDGAGPHQLTFGPDGPYFYDLNGDQYQGPNRAASLTRFHLPRTITTGAGTTTFDYTADGKRAAKTMGADITVYLGGLYQHAVHNGVTTNTSLVMADGRPVSQFVSRSDEAYAPKYQTLLFDQIGSTVGIVENGALISRFRFEPFGRHISTSDLSGEVTADISATGFAGQTPDDELELVDMKGRLYDPKIGRFLSSDPHVGRSAFSQDFAHYSYALNSPLSLIDPTGFDVCSSTGNCNDPSSFQAGGPIVPSYPFEDAVDSLVNMDPDPPVAHEEFLKSGSAVPMEELLAAISRKGSREEKEESPTMSRVVAGLAFTAALAIAVAVPEVAVAEEVLVPRAAAALAEAAVAEASVETGVAAGAARVEVGAAMEARALTVTDIFEQHVESAVARFEMEGFTSRQAAALFENPRLEAAFRGDRIDGFFKELVKADSRLSEFSVTPRGTFGPDVYHTASETWWDVTTPGQWAAHEERYSAAFGSGIPLLY